MFNTDIKVRFNHVDFAGLVFYPRYFEMFNQVIEEWCEGQLGYDFQRLHEDLNAGVPVVHIDVDFKLPSRLGDVLTFALTVEKVGRSSISIVLEAVCDDEVRLKGNLTMVYIEKTGGGGINASEIPPELKQLMLET
ncbi:acyl-CoA thioesterase [Arenicella xantha]|uniref:4-hydroxybenzoyl-CoA thioesterase n=1 Tax=Arenicella xantha TaxID=644221 RepID=A0A395JQC2_9GAMM|nr:thioesterase family protein [Arenicella xantha]RBP53553.1 4-hydroxybenzoyl-CoA thioesterase [Arenicella xantha]